ncbi:MAG: substrate-binding domain-containing protein [Clostridiales bacterium]|nr:substrate-binding domain-containing protein [Clostridiales bacterium]
MKKLLTITLALVMVLAMGALASAEGLVVAFSQIGAESDWRTANTDDVNAAIEAEGWTLVYDDAQQKSENQVKALNNFITQGVDYIVFTANDAAGFGDILKQVNEEGIPLVLIDRFPDAARDGSIDYTAYFGGDFPEEGARSVRWLANYLEKEGRAEEEINIVMLEGTIGADAQVGRSKGILAELENHPNFKLIDKNTGDFTRAVGQAVMESFLKSHDDIDVLIAQNDDMALGAIDAIKAAGKVPGKDIIIIGIDGVKAAFEAIIAGEMNCTVECTPLMGSFVVDTIKRLEAGETFEGDDKTIHPIEGVFCADGDIVYGADADGNELKSVKAEDVIAERKY